MTPRDPEDSSDMDSQNRHLPNIHDKSDDDMHAAPVSKSRSAPAPVPQLEKGVDTKLDHDRVEAYLRGPTVFSA